MEEDEGKAGSGRPLGRAEAAPALCVAAASEQGRAPAAPGGGFGDRGWAPLGALRLSHCVELPGAGAVLTGPQGRAA